jgi:nitrile hydratase subunit beta
MVMHERVTARFSLGDRVRVLELDKTGHIRTPYYIRHHLGEVIQCCGHFLNPEDLSVGSTAGPVIPLYRVRFRMNELWPGYERNPGDVLVIEIYDHWLSSADETR